MIRLSTIFPSHNTLWRHELFWVIPKDFLNKDTRFSGLSADAETKIVNDTQTCFRSKCSVNLRFARANCSSNELSAIIVCYFNEINQSVNLISWPIMVCSHWPTVTLWTQVLHAEAFILPRDRDRHWIPIAPCIHFIGVGVCVGLLTSVNTSQHGHPLFIVKLPVIWLKRKPNTATVIWHDNLLPLFYWI